MRMANDRHDRLRGEGWGWSHVVEGSRHGDEEGMGSLLVLWGTAKDIMQSALLHYTTASTGQCKSSLDLRLTSLIILSHSSEQASAPCLFVCVCFLGLSKPAATSIKSAVLFFLFILGWSPKRTFLQLAHLDKPEKQFVFTFCGIEESDLMLCQRHPLYDVF